MDGGAAFPRSQAPRRVPRNGDAVNKTRRNAARKRRLARRQTADLARWIDNPPALFMDADEAAFRAAMRADARECLRRIDSPWRPSLSRRRLFFSFHVRARTRYARRYSRPGGRSLFSAYRLSFAADERQGIPVDRRCNRRSTAPRSPCGARRGASCRKTSRPRCRRSPPKRRCARRRCLSLESNQSFASVSFDARSELEPLPVTDDAELVELGDELRPLDLPQFLLDGLHRKLGKRP